MAAWRRGGPRGVLVTEGPQKPRRAMQTPTRPPSHLPPPPPQISRHDTLAGIAVRYGVSPADVRRANGLLSDSAMFARPTLLVPRGPPPPVE